MKKKVITFRSEPMPRDLCTQLETQRLFPDKVACYSTSEGIEVSSTDWDKMIEAKGFYLGYLARKIQQENWDKEKRIK